MGSADSSRNPTPKLSSKPAAKVIDLGAATNFGKSEVANSSAPPSSVTNINTSVAASTSQVGNADLVDLLTGSLDSTSFTSQPFQTAAAPVQNDFFADFASAPPSGGSISGAENSNGKKFSDM